MNCKQALRLLYDVIDNEANETDKAEVEKHLKICRHCMAEYEFERLFKRLVVEKGSARRDNEDLKDRIMSQIDSMDAAEGVGKKRPFNWFPVAMAAAASLILCVVAAFLVSDFYRYQTRIAPFISAYAAHASQMDADNRLDYGTDPHDYLTELTGIHLNRNAFPTQYIQSVGVDTIMGIPFASIEMNDPRNPQSSLTIFVTTADKYTLPEEPNLMVDGRRLFVHTCDKCSIVGREKQDLVFVVVAEPDRQPRELARLTAGW